MPVLFNAAIFVSKSGSLYVILRMWSNNYTLSSYMIWRVCNNTNDTKKNKTIGASWRVVLNFFSPLQTSGRAKIKPCQNTWRLNVYLLGGVGDMMLLKY